MTLTQTKKRGFTIVELLIVIVVIAILAAITIVAYNGITTRANSSAAKGNATTLQKKVETYTQVNNGTLPASGTSLITQLNSYSESAVTGTGITVTAAGANPDATNGKNTFRVKYCSAPVGATGFEIGYWDYSNSTVATVTGGGNTTVCTTYGTNATP